MKKGSSRYVNGEDKRSKPKEGRTIQRESQQECLAQALFNERQEPSNGRARYEVCSPEKASGILSPWGPVSW